MAIKVFSGMIWVPRGGIGQGSVVITFEPFELSESSRPEFELRKKRVIGPPGRFKAKPASIIGAREFVLIHEPLSFSSAISLQIDDTVGRDSISIDWNTRPGFACQSEIPFMVIGEVKEAPKPPNLPDQPKGPKDRKPPGLVPVKAKRSARRTPKR